MLERLPERVRTPAMARAATSPSAVLLAGAGTAAAILGGVPLAGAAAVGALAWAARVALALPRAPAGDRVNPRALRQPWRNLVENAQEARSRFDRTVDRARPGPLRDRLADLGRRLDHGVDECWRVARQGDSLDGAVDQLDVAQVRRELAFVVSEKERATGQARASLERAEQAVRAQLASAERMHRVATDARNRLVALNAQLDEAVARAVELSVTAGDARALSPLSADVDSLVGELESLREALEEATGAAGALGAGPA